MLPIAGVQNRLRDGKVKLLSDTKTTVQQTVERIHAGVNSGDYEDSARLNSALSALRCAPQWLAILIALTVRFIF